jgi:hypothetical protein
MSKRYKGGVLSATPPTTSISSATGIWTEQQLMQAVAAGTWPNIPGAPTIGTATAGPLTASVTFTAPAYVGTGITGYTVTSSPGGVTGTGASSPIVVSGLTAGTSYTFTVTASTAGGTGPASAASNSVTPFAPVYIEDVFQTWLYTGNGSDQTITNGVDLSTKGGLVWVKNRTSASFAQNTLFDTARGAGAGLISNLPDAQNASYTQSFSSTGFALGGDNATNQSVVTYTSWAFREQPKFFDVVTYVGDGEIRNIPHNLGSVPGCIMVKRTDASRDWAVYHRSLDSAAYYLVLNGTFAQQNGPNRWNSTAPTSTVFTVGANTDVNAAFGSYVAYIFAHDAGGFGASGSENVISCGSFTTDGSGDATVNLGYEPQWILQKCISRAGDNWIIIDDMRGFTTSRGSTRPLFPNTAGVEQASTFMRKNTPTSYGFQANQEGTDQTFIYVAIRKGPMKVPTSGTDVFQPVKFISTASRQTIGSLPAVDMFFGKRMGSLTNWGMSPRLTLLFLKPNLTDAEDGSATGYGDTPKFDLQNGSSFITSGSGDEFVTYNLRRAPSFMDVVCYTGTGANRTVAHNLGVTPEMMIVKDRTSGVYDWRVYSATTSATKYLKLNGDSGEAVSSAVWNDTSPTASVFTVGSNATVNSSGDNYVAYLFATCAGVSKVGSYTGTGTTLQINCGFTAGSRFVLIKRTDSTGDWYVWDSARGITAGDDPYLLLNSTAREVTNTDYIDTYSAGFEIGATAPSAINANGGTFIFLAIA